jgi:hypothetical protein
MSSESKRAVALRQFFSQAASYFSVEGEKWKERVVGKAAGDERVFIPGRGPGLADEARSDTIPGAPGGE